MSRFCIPGINIPVLERTDIIVSSLFIGLILTKIAQSIVIMVLRNALCVLRYV